jgi:hypothetical protein
MIAANAEERNRIMISRTEAEQRVFIGFWIHFGIYLAVICGLAALNISRNPDKLWFLWVACGWGIGVGVHALSLFALPGGRERMIEHTADRMERRADRREQRHAL